VAARGRPLDTARGRRHRGCRRPAGQLRAFDGQEAEAAKQAITAWLAAQGLGKAVVQYRLHDWCISRQRYWGPPIPIIYCDACGPVPVPEPDLPVILPPIEDFRPDDSGVSPLARHEEWYFVPCPPAARAAGARPTSRTPSSSPPGTTCATRAPSSPTVPFDPARTRVVPGEFYIGGNEHAVLHLLYSRFITMVLKDLGHIDFEEPFTRFRAHGLIVKDGSKMSKSRGNVVIPDEYIAQWGADTFRMYLMFLGPYEEGGDFRDAGINGVGASSSACGCRLREAEESGGEPQGRGAPGGTHHQEVRRGHRGAALQHRHRGDDGVHEPHAS
jgi:leucyl-tRNA synthetase